MIIIKLKEAMLAYGRRVNRTITYADAAEITGISAATLRSIGSRPGYHCTFERVEILCRALGVPLHDMLEMIDTPPEAEEPAKAPKSKKTSKKARKQRKQNSSLRKKKKIG